MSVSALDLDGNPTEPLPPKFESIRDILEVSDERLKKQSFTNVIGIVTDFQAPCETKGTGNLPSHKTASSNVDYRLEVCIYLARYYNPVRHWYQGSYLLAT